MIQSGLANNFPTRVWETDVSQVTEGVPGGGWVSGSPAGLAPSASVTCYFDLGQDWHQYPLVQINVAPRAPSSGLNAVNAMSGDTVGSVSDARRLAAASATGATVIYANLATSSGPQAFLVRPMGRILGVAMTNADASNAVGASAKVTLAAYSD